MEGWVSIHRQLNDHWLWKEKPFSKGQAWIDILIRVNHKPASVPIGNQIVSIEKGETIWSVLDMSLKWGWSRTKTENFLKLLEKEKQITTKKTTKYTIVSVLNWDSYQTKDTEKDINKASKGHQKNINKASKEQQESTNNNEDNDNNEFNENKKPKELKTFLSDSYEYRLSKLLHDRILLNNPDAKHPDIQAWSRTIDLMIRIDKRDPQVIAKVIDFCQKDSFWKSNILSTSKLRDKFDQLVLKMKEPKQHAKGSIEELTEIVNSDHIQKFLRGGE